jgi:hypothetical protein
MSSKKIKLCSPTYRFSRVHVTNYVCLSVMLGRLSVGFVSRKFPAGQSSITT